MRTKHTVHFHIPSSLGMFFGIAACLMLAYGAYIFLVPHTYPARISVAIIGNPYMVVSYDVGQKTAVIVTIPSDVSMTAVHDYGKYRLSALWSLDGLEKRKGLLFTDTLEENLGLPVRLYVTGDMREKADITDVEILTVVQHAFSFQSVLQDLFHPSRTNVPFPEHVALLKGIQGLDKKDVTIIRTLDYATYKEILPDESSIISFDPKRFSLHLETHAEDSFIRKETPRIVIYNTTNTPGLAQNVARLIEGAGGHVVSVGNDTLIHTDGCILKGSEQLKESYTAKSISWLYQCHYEVSEDVAVADFALYLGKAFEKRFLPYEK